MNYRNVYVCLLHWLASKGGGVLYKNSALMDSNRYLRAVQLIFLGFPTDDHCMMIYIQFHLLTQKSMVVILN